MLITRVEPLSAAFDGGISRGTILLEINRQPIDVGRRLPPHRRARVSPGDVLTLFVYSPDIDQRQLKTVRVEDK